MMMSFRSVSISNDAAPQLQCPFNMADSLFRWQVGDPFDWPAFANTTSSKSLDFHMIIDARALNPVLPAIEDSC